MAALDGANRVFGIKLATTLGTATAIGANDKVEGVITSSENAEALRDSPVGSGDSMANDIQRGAALPSASYSGTTRFAGANLVALSQLMGTASVSGPGPGGFYHHSVTFNETANAKYLTIADLILTQSVLEHTTAVCTRAAFSTDNVPAYLALEQDFVSNSMTFQSSTNTSGTMASATIEDTDRVVVQYASVIRMNPASGGALASTANDIPITGLTFELMRPQEFVREIKGSTGLGAPRSASDVPFAGKLTVTFRSINDVNFILDHQSGKEFKCDFKVASSQSSNKFFEWSIPRMKIISSPSIESSNPGNNPLTIEFECLVAASNPTGMISTYPYFRIACSRSTGFLA